MALVRLSMLLGREEYARKAERILEANALLVQRVPQGFAHLLCAADFSLHAPAEIVVAGDPAKEDTRALLRTIRRIYLPNKVVALRGLPEEAEEETVLPLTLERRLVDGRAAAYVCRNQTCGLPAVTVAELEKQLGVLR